MRKAASSRNRKTSNPKSARNLLLSKRSATADRGGATTHQTTISIFILFHLIAITCVAVPWNLPLIQGVKGLVAPYLRWTGLYQTWDMFAPDPVKINAYVKSVVMTEHRHVHVWSFPRMEELSFAERYRKERYRKFAEILPLPQNAALWPDVARHIAGFFPSPGDPPDKVILIQFVSDIVAGANGSRDPVARPNVFYDDYLQPGGSP